jgi:DNA repair exonuclease SbcCD nuclease subunit
MNRAIKFMRAFADVCETYVLVGNHDMINNQQYLNENHWMVMLKDTHPRLHIIDYPTSIPFGTFNVGMCPYVFPGKFKETMTLAETPLEEYTMLFAHQEFKGCKMGAIVSEEGDEWEPSLPLVVSGHIHNKQRPQPNIIYSGTPIQHAFGESEDNCMLHITLPCTITEVPLSITNKKIVYMTIDQLRKIDPEKYSSKEIKVVVKATNDEIQAFKKTSVFTNLSKKVRIVFKVDVEDLVEIQETSNATTFDDILYDLIQKKYPNALDDYREIFSR